jgi:3-hydroxyisobutyrate dehydrogenase
MLHKDNTKIGFVGLGVMGRSMASHLLKAGYSLNVYTRTKATAGELLQAGAVWRDSVAELAAVSDVIVTIVGYPTDVEEVYLGDDGIVAHAKRGAHLIDMTTSTPALAKRIHDEAAKRGLHALDAPVSGGDIGAREARLTIMVGGDKAAFAEMQPLLALMGANIVRQGGAGAGQHTKMCNQIAIASNMMGVCEALAYAKSAGLDPQTVLKSISAGAAGSWSLSNLAPRILDGDFAPGFFIKHFIKDMNIALQSAEEMGLPVPGLTQAKALYDHLAAQGEENFGTQALFHWYEQQRKEA